MKTSNELRAEAKSLRVAYNLLKMGGNMTLATEARNELMGIYAELEARADRNKAQIDMYKNRLVS